MLLYILPQYIQGIGDGCILREDDCEKTLQVKMNQVLKNICKERMLDFKEVKRKSSRAIGQNNVIPLYLNHEEIMLPLKVRKPKVSRDEVYGYVNFDFIDKIEEGHVLLKDGQKIFYIERSRAVLKRSKLVRILKKEFKTKEPKGCSLDFNSPATKEDIFLLLTELYNIKKLLE